MSEVDFYGLLYFPDKKEDYANISSKIDPSDIYFLCACNASRSFAAFDYRYRLITNSAENVREKARILGVECPPTVELAFTKSIPDTIGFASAHRKIELISAFASGEFGHQPAIVDLDVELIRPFPAGLFSSDEVHAIDLTGVMMEEFDTQVAGYLNKIADRPFKNPRWFGGEFLSTSHQNFGRISCYVEEYWDLYMDMVMGSIHEGDEAIVSAAINSLIEDGVKFHDSRSAGIASRYWSSRTITRQNGFADCYSSSLLHLPSDKPFLASRAKSRPEPTAFKADYRAAVSKKLAVRRGLTLLERLAGRKNPKHAARW